MYLYVPQILAEKQARKLWSRPLIVDSKQSVILKALLEFQDVNRLHEQLVTIEGICSLYGQTIILLDKYPNETPRLSYADPFALSIVTKFHITEKTVKRTWYLPSKQIDSGSGVRVDIAEFKDIMEVEERPTALVAYQ